MNIRNHSRKKNIRDFTLVELHEVFNDWNETAYRGEQLWSGLHKQFIDDAFGISNLPLNLRERLANEYTFSELSLKTQQKSHDNNTMKTLFELDTGEFIEAVLMQYNQRNTLCISSQAGCAMNCSFCATGQMGFSRNLTEGEIIEQVHFLARYLRDSEKKVTNIVLMGMGEPFHNYEAVMRAIAILNDPKGMNLGERRFTISTVGIIPGIKRFSEENCQVNLAISLHAVDDDLRSSMIPINRKYPVDALLAASRDYTDRSHRRVSFEWALIHDVNDGIDHAKKLARKLSGMLCHVNLIQLNPTFGYKGIGSSRDRANSFARTLIDSGIPASIRLRRGVDIQAGCGQLAAIK